MSGFSWLSPSVQRVRSYLLRAGERGATDREVEEALGLSRATVCGARKVLLERGEVQWTGGVRQVEAGQPPRVWRAVES